MLMSVFCLMMMLISYHRSNLQATANTRNYLRQLNWYTIRPEATVRPVNLQNHQNRRTDQSEKRDTASQPIVPSVLTASFFRSTPLGTYQMKVYRRPKIHQSTTLYAPFRNQPDLVLWITKCYSDLLENFQPEDANNRQPLSLTKRDEHLDNPNLSVYEAETQSGILRKFLRKLKRMVNHIQLPSCNKRMVAKQQLINRGQNQAVSRWLGEFITKGIFQELDYNRDGVVSEPELELFLQFNEILP
ncbi:hypothetical protein P879_01114 [Paragonimus westermani]|uniref:EF-hand domain-containing protein n=1 Tax=Paragonimus westermani TaxID=34504 RepID=A0A8T0D2U4_9TREM|nr:hypothetical protein P879_01114 [Paragonimus westermani]